MKIVIKAEDERLYILDGVTSPSTGVITFDIDSLIKKFEDADDD